MKLRGGATEAGYGAGQFRAGPIRLLVDARGNYIVRWHGSPQTAYKRIPLIQMVCTMHPDVCDASVQKHPVSEFRDKIVFIGASAAGAYEVRPTAVSETAPGVFILATALDNLLHNDAMTRSPAWLGFLLILVLTALPAAAVGASRTVAVPLGGDVGRRSGVRRDVLLAVPAVYVADDGGAYAGGGQCHSRRARCCGISSWTASCRGREELWNAMSRRNWRLRDGQPGSRSASMERSGS